MKYKCKVPCYVAHSTGHTHTFCLYIILAKPTSTNLTVIRWRNERGEIKKFHQAQVERCWQLGVPRQLLEVWAREKDSKECCEAILSHWLDHPPRHYPATWKGLYELLDDSELGQVATELEQAVDNAI